PDFAGRRPHDIGRRAVRPEPVRYGGGSASAAHRAGGGPPAERQGAGSPGGGDGIAAGPSNEADIAMTQAVIDAHHHIWRQADLPWLAGPMVPRIFGPYEPIRRDYGIEEYL